MIRLLGVISGSGLAVATLLLLIGIPRFESDAVQAERTPVRLPRPTQPVEQPDRAPEPEAQPVSQAEPRATADPDSGETGAAAGQALPVTSAAANEAGTDGDAAVSLETAPTPDAEPVGEDRWYAFWSPFKSRIAAEGFVARLQSVTGLDYRIVRRKPGAWEVSFSYRDDDDIAGQLSQIAAATGLDLPETP